MTDTSAQPATQNVLQVIEADVKSFISTAENMAENVALDVWLVLKVGYTLITSQQARIMVDLLTKLEVDEVAGKSVEQIETDLLGMASAEELAVLKTAESAIIQGFIAFWKASQ